LGENTQQSVVGGSAVFAGPKVSLVQRILVQVEGRISKQEKSAGSLGTFFVSATQSFLSSLRQHTSLIAVLIAI